MKIKQRIANAFGYDLTRRTKKHDSFEAHFHNLMEKYKINCVINVGTNRGQYGQKLRALGFDGRICSFEPVKKNFHELQSVSTDDLNWKVYHYALGVEERALEINVFKSTDLTSFLSPTKEFNEMFKSENKAVIEYLEKVKIMPLSSFWEEIISEMEHPKIMLKMDTQGYDIEVFKGTQQMIDQVSVLQSELSVIPLYQGMPDYIATLSEFRSVGFEVSGVFPISRNLHDLRIVEFDCVLVNPNQIQKKV